jgi:hypothetical protein
MRETFRTEVEAFQFGGVIDLLLEIESTLNPMLTTDDFGDGLTAQRRFIMEMCEKAGCEYLRWNILRAVTLLQVVEMGALEELMIGTKDRGILERVAAPLDRLRAWFGFRSGELKKPLLGRDPTEIGV